GLITQPGMVIAQPAFVAAQLFGQPLGRGVKGRVVIGGRRAALDHDAAADMQRQVGADQMRLAGENGVRLDRGPKIFAEKGIEAGFDVTPQCAADIDLLSGDSQLHGQNHSILEVAAYRALKRNWASRRARSSAALVGCGHKLSIFSRRRCTEDGMRIASRYLATVRRAMSTPS